MDFQSSLAISSRALLFQNERREKTFDFHSEVQTCEFVLPELVVFKRLLHGLDGRVVDAQQLLHST